MREFYPKYWKSKDFLTSFYFYFFSDFLIEVYLLNRFLYLLNSLNKTLKLLENGKKILEKSEKSHGNLSVQKCGNQHGHSGDC